MVDIIIEVAGLLLKGFFKNLKYKYTKKINKN